MIDRITFDHQAGDYYQWEGDPTPIASPEFLHEPDGTPFRRLVPYRIWKVRPSAITDVPAERLSYDFFFDGNGTPTPINKYTDTTDPSAVTLDTAARNGSWTKEVLRMPNASLWSLPEVSEFSFIFVAIETPLGTQFAKIKKDDLIGVPDPVYVCDGYYVAQPVDTTPVYVCDGYYVAQPTVTLTAPGKPVNVTITKGAAGTTNAVLSWDAADGRATEFWVYLTNPDGSWSNAYTIVTAPTEVLSLSSVGYGVTLKARIKAHNSAGESLYSDETTVRFNTFIYNLGLYGVGNPPVLSTAMSIQSTGGRYAIPATPGSQGNFGLLVRDRNQQTPTTQDYDRTIFMVTFPDGIVRGWSSYDPQTGPGATPLFVSPRPNGAPLLPGNYTLTFSMALGMVVVDTLTVQFTLTARGTPPNAPTELAAVYLNQQSAKLTWRANATNADAQRIYYRQQQTNDWLLLATVGQSAAEYTTGALSNQGVTYEFYVIATNNYGDSAPSNTAYLNPYIAPLLFTGMRARSVALMGVMRRLEIEALTSVSITPQFQLIDNSGPYGGFFDTPLTGFGSQVFATEYEPGNTNYEVNVLTAIQARNANNTAQLSPVYAINAATLGSNWTTLTAIS